LEELENLDTVPQGRFWTCNGTVGRDLRPFGCAQGDMTSLQRGCPFGCVQCDVVGLVGEVAGFRLSPERRLDPNP